MCFSHLLSLGIRTTYNFPFPTSKSSQTLSSPIVSLLSIWSIAQLAEKAVNMAESKVAEVQKKYEAKWGKPPSDANQLVAFAKKCGLSLRYGEASKYLTLIEKESSTHRPEPQQKTSNSKQTPSPIPPKERDATTQPLPDVTTISRYSRFSRDELEKEMYRLEKEIASLKKVITFFSFM